MWVHMFKAFYFSIAVLWWQELSLPLRMYIDNFPRKHQLHAYEYALIDLTFGTGKYEEVKHV